MQKVSSSDFPMSNLLPNPGKNKEFPTVNLIDLFENNEVKEPKPLKNVKKDLDHKPLLTDTFRNYALLQISLQHMNINESLLQFIKNGEDAQVQFFLELGADPNQPGESNRTPLHQAVIANNSPKVIEHLLEYGADIEAVNAEGMTPFLLAAKLGNLRSLKTLLERGAKADAKAMVGSGRNALHLCACPFAFKTYEEKKKGDLCLKYLLDQGLDANPVDGFGETPLHKSIVWVSPRLNAVRLLLTHKADISAKDNSGDTPLHHAAERGTPDSIKVLLENSSEVETYVNAKGKDGLTSLHYAARNGNSENLKLLLKNGANVNETDANGKTALDHAKQESYSEGRRECIEQLEVHMAPGGEPSCCTIL